MSEDKDLLYIYGEKVQRPAPIEPMTKEELKQQQIPEGRREEYEQLMKMCATDCKHCGMAWKQYSYGGNYMIEIPFLCNIDAAERVCQGACSKYKKQNRLAYILSKRPAHGLEEYVKAFKDNRYDKALRRFSWYKKNK